VTDHARSPARWRYPESVIRSWIDTHVIDLFRQVRLSYLPPLLVYMAAGIAGLTGIVGGNQFSISHRRHVKRIHFLFLKK
jgi:hypothetical protein